MPLRRMCLLGLIVATSANAAGNDGRPLREAASQNRAYALRIEPGRPGRSGAPCMATLAQLDKGGARGKEIWKRPLVNDVAPAQIFIRNDGKFTITLDEHGRGGARNALVIYGADGRLLRHFLVTDMLNKEDWRQVRTSKRSLDWLDDARCRFDTPRNIFLIELRWGRSVVVDLQTLQVVRSTTDTPTGLLLDVPPQVMALLESSAMPENDVAPAEVATTQPAGNEPLVSNSAEAPPSTETAATSPALIATDATSPEAPPEEPAAPPEIAAAEPDDAVESTFPPPNPQAPVDYVSWLNRFGEVDPSQNARPLYDAAAGAFVAFEGDAALVNRALSGDTDALMSPEIARWLESNSTALEKFRQGAMLDHRSWTLHSADGSMLSVLLPDLAPMRQLAKASIVEARRLAALGDTAEAADRMLDTLAAGGHVGSGATLIENLVGTAMQLQGADALLDLQADAPEGVIDFTALAREAEAAAQPVAPYGDVLIGERLMALDTLQRVYQPRDDGTFAPDRDRIIALAGQVGSGSPDEVAAALQAWAPVDSAGFDAIVGDMNDYYDRASDAVGAPYVSGRQQLDELDASVVARRTTNPVLSQLAPALSRAHLARTRGEATRRAAVLVANLNAFRQQHGDYPDSLEAFAGRDFATDPFTGGGFIYRREGDSFRLYSTAANGADDGGAHDPRAETGDVVFWPRPPRQ